MKLLAKLPVLVTMAAVAGYFLLLTKGPIGMGRIILSEGYTGQYILATLQDQVGLFLKVLLPGVWEKRWATISYRGLVFLPFTVIFSEGRSAAE